MSASVKTIGVLALLVLLVLVQRQPGSGNAAPEQPGGAAMLSGKATRIVDGDSLYIEGVKKQIRLWAVDAPETHEAGYDAAKAELKRLAYKKRLRCHVQDVDKYGRKVARCENDVGIDINRAMLESGKAEEYCRFSRNHYGFCRS